MTQEPKIIIVSKGEYVRRQTNRVAGALMGGCLGILAIPFAVATAVLLLYFFAYLCSGYADVVGAIFLLIAIVLTGGGARLLYTSGYTMMKKAQTLAAGIPFTRANTADLPVPESLLRASAEPLQAQNTVLLRAAMETKEKQEELLRASLGGQE